MDLAAARKLFAPLPVASVATVGPDGAPHVVPLWFVWPEDALYGSARRPGRTCDDATSRPPPMACVERGRTGPPGLVRDRRREDLGRGRGHRCARPRRGACPRAARV